MSSVRATNQFATGMKGGQVASRIETQDSSALILAIEAIGGLLSRIPNNIVDHVGRMSLEKVDDIEIRWDSGVLVVSVKDKSVDYNDLKVELNKFTTLSESPDYREGVFRIEAGALRGSTARSLVDDMDRLRQVGDLGVVDEWLGCKSDFEQRHGVAANVAANTIVSIRDLSRDSVTLKAVFATTVRAVFPVQNFTDATLVSLFDEHTSIRIAPARRQRRTIMLRELRDAILLPLVPAELIATSSHYMKTSIGYIYDPNVQRARVNDERIKRAAYRKILRRWRKHTWRMVLADLLYRGPLACPFCGGILTRALLGSRAFVCTHCLYQPYLTLFYACDCRSPVMLIRQPSVDGLTTFAELLTELRQHPKECDLCHQKVMEERLYGRTFGFSAPWPIEDFSEDDIIQIRVRIGWRGLQFKVPGQSPLTLMRQGSWDMVEPRICHEDGSA